MTAFTVALARWHDFYLLIGGAAATLMGLGLLFVPLSFGVDRVVDAKKAE